MKNNDVKKKKGRLVAGFFSLFAIIVLLLLAISVGFNHTFSWFAANKEVTGSGMQVVVDGSLFELHVDNAGETPQIVPDPDGENNPLKSPFDDVLTHFEGLFKLGEEISSIFTRINDTSPANPHIYCNMINEGYSVDGKSIAPGAYGTISFDIVPKTTQDFTFTISLNKIGLRYDSSVEGSDKLVTVDSNATGADLQAFNLLQGHILIFQNRDNSGFYSNQVTDSFVFDTTNYSADSDGNYRVTLYWIWPHNFSQMVLVGDDYRLHTKPLFSVDNTSDLTSLRSVIKNEVKNDGTSKYFTWSEHDPFGTLTNNYYNDYYIDLSNGYNNGDQIIGETFKYLAIEMSVEIIDNT